MYWGDPLAKVGSSAKFLYWYSKHLCSGTGGSISQCRFICQVLCSGMQVISPLVLQGGSIGQCRFICQILCTGMQVISPLVLQGGPSANVGSSAKFWCSSIPDICAKFPGGSICQSMFICQVLCTGMQGKYHLSELKSLIVIWGIFWGFWEVLRGVTSDMSVQS